MAKHGEVQRYYAEVVLPYSGDACLFWPYGKRGKKGYGTMQSGGANCLVHRLVCEEENGPPPTSEHEAAHSCGKGHLGCVAKRHLSWKTPVQNYADRLAHGTHQLGERNTLAKLTEDDVREIRALKGEKKKKEIAIKFGVSPSNISVIHARKSWAWL